MKVTGIFICLGLLVQLDDMMVKLNVILPLHTQETNVLNQWFLLNGSYINRAVEERKKIMFNAYNTMQLNI